MSSLFSLLLAQVPRLVIVAGLIICAVFALRLKHRLGSLASGLGASGMTLLAIADALSVTLVLTARDIMEGPRGYVAFAWLNLLVMAIGAVGLGLLVAAVFVRRPTPSQPTALDAYARQ